MEERVVSLINIKYTILFKLKSTLFPHTPKILVNTPLFLCTFFSIESCCGTAETLRRFSVSRYFLSKMGNRTTEECFLLAFLFVSLVFLDFLLPFCYSFFSSFFFFPLTRASLWHLCSVDDWIRFVRRPSSCVCVLKMCFHSYESHFFFRFGFGFCGNRMMVSAETHQSTGVFSRQPLPRRWLIVQLAEPLAGWRRSVGLVLSCLILLIAGIERALM